mmetsp:Transcript_49734/g.92667  ORF Transcript_49734/g.92667 Transcript_49734/m.92667 type:complete len:676 (+) Transcript_49734:119-2146(+)
MVINACATSGLCQAMPIAVNSGHHHGSFAKARAPLRWRPLGRLTRAVEPLRICSVEGRPLLRRVLPIRAASTVPTPIPPSPDYSVEEGAPTPLGPSMTDGVGVNFAVFSEHATAVTLCLLVGWEEEVREFPMHRTGNYWHSVVCGLPGSNVRYSYRVFGEGGWDTGNRWSPESYLLDPYAPLVASRPKYGEGGAWGGAEGWWGTFDLDSPAFDWGADYQKPNIPFQDLIVYEVAVRGFTAHESSKLGPLSGSYLGLASKIEHLKELGVNAVELLPVHEFDEMEFQRSKNARDHMVNTWGYSTINFFAPMTRYAADGGGAVAARNEFKEMVRLLHNNGIEVLLDVVYNHTAEGGDDDPYLISMRGFDNKVYYMVNTSSYVQLMNYSGCGNTVNCNHPVVAQLIVDSLKHWVEEYHVDGFRFDLASILCRGQDGAVLKDPPLIRAITKDPVLSKVKLISEPWDCGGDGYLVGQFPNWDIWGEWNGKYRDSARSFLKGSDGAKKEFASRLSGSADIYNYNNRKPYHSINFITAHDGFTLYDLVAYNEKHNEANGEGGRDGANDNLSWNCGWEGHTDNANINGLRQRQMKNMMTALLVSQGTPMIVSGDEYGHTRDGNNNAYGHDNWMTQFQWDRLERKRDHLFRFVSGLVHFRKNHKLLGMTHFLSVSSNATRLLTCV